MPPIKSHLQANAAQPSSSSQVDVSSAGLGSASIALLAHNDNLREVLLASLLTSNFGRVNAYSSLAELNAANTQSKFDALIIDLDLPSGDGLSICAEQRKRNARLTMMAMSSRSDTKQRIAALNAGADHFLEKPVSHAELIAGIKRSLSRTHLS